MSESKTIYVPNDIPVGARIQEAKTQISEWMQSFDEPFRPEKDTLHLVKCEQRNETCSYLYKIERDTGPSRRPWDAEK